MGEQIKRTGNEIVERWQSRMPRFFYWLMVIACGIGGTAFAINTGVPMMGGQLHEWWGDIYTYVISVCIGIIFACKFTCDGGFRDKTMDKINNNTLLDKDDN